MRSNHKTDSAEAPLPERFKLIHGGLIRVATEYFKNIMLSVGTSLLALGWILTSESARDFLAASPIVKVSALVAIPVLTLLDLASHYWAFRMCRKMNDQLDELNYFPRADFEEHGIPKPFLFINGAVHLALLTPLWLFIWSLDKPTDKPESAPTEVSASR